MSGMKSVKWLRPYMTAISKHYGLKDPGFIAKAREVRKMEDDWLPLTAEELADETGDYIALSARMIQWLMSIKVDGATDNGWHLPYRAFRVGVEDGSDMPPFIASWMPASEYQALGPPDNAAAIKTYPATEWILSIGIRDHAPSDGGPLVLCGAFPRQCIQGVMVRGIEEISPLGLSRTPADDLSCDYLDWANESLRDVVRVVIALGVYLSLGVNDPDIPSAESKKIAPPPRDRPAGYRLRTLTDPPGASGCSPHLVRPHVRRLKHERYYRGVWADYPRGSRYSLVSAHVRGHQSETEHDADLHGVV